MATNLGCFWPQQGFWKAPGTAIIEFIEPIPTGLHRTEFLSRLEKAIEDRTAEVAAPHSRPRSPYPGGTLMLSARGLREP